MAHLLGDLVHWYHDLMDNRSDHRVKDWPMMSSPIPTLVLCISYAYFCKSLAPRLMKDRKPFDLRKTLVYYNLFQTVFSAWIFYEFLQSGWLRDYSYRCQPVDYTPKGLRMAKACWWYYISKFTEFFDTFFFILRKKYQHVSTLHVIHHGVMPFSVWMGMKFAPGGHSTFFAMLNAFVHIVMYFYYMLSAIPSMQPYLWWKKYLTAFQMIQFVAIFTHQFQLLWTDCNYPKGFMVWIGLHGVMFLFLFSDFYKQSYINKKEKANSHKKESSNGKVYINGNGKAANSVDGHHEHRNGEEEELLNGGNYLNGHIEKNGIMVKGIESSNGVVRSRK